MLKLLLIFHFIFLFMGSNLAFAEVVDDMRSPTEKHITGKSSMGAFDVNNPNHCSGYAATKWIGPYFYNNNYTLYFDRDLSRNVTVGEATKAMLDVITDAFLSLQDAGDLRILGHHVCVGFYNYQNKPNAYSHVMGYIAVDPQLLFILQNLGRYKTSVTSLIVLHEFAHQVQFWTVGPFFNDANARRMELAADCIGAGLGAMITLKKSRFQEIASRFVEMHYLLADEALTALGDINFEAETHHGTSIERHTATRYGAQLVTQKAQSQKSLKGITMEFLLNSCNNFIINRDKNYGPNWPNVP